MLLRKEEHRISDVAKVTGIPKSTLHCWINYKVSPKLDVRILNLAKYFNVTIEQLVFCDMSKINFNEQDVAA
jgi:DNA-binding XRE family transcriptional regulator